MLCLCPLDNHSVAYFVRIMADANLWQFQIWTNPKTCRFLAPMLSCLHSLLTPPASLYLICGTGGLCEGQRKRNLGHLVFTFVNVIRYYLITSVHLLPLHRSYDWVQCFISIWHSDLCLVWMMGSRSAGTTLYLGKGAKRLERLDTKIEYWKR